MEQAGSEISMSRVPITIMGFRCDQCGHEWLPKSRVQDSGSPRRCPKCKSLKWDSPPSTSQVGYDLFRDKVRSVLSNGSTLTWTEVRTRAQLPQRFPNNVWVRRLERDIGLFRSRDNHGIIHWSIKDSSR